MSTELEIRSDENYSTTASRKDLHSFLATFPNVSMLGERYGEFEEDERDLFMQIYLVIMDESGEVIDLADDAPEVMKDRVDAVSLHIAAGSVKSDYGLHPYIDICRRIAEHLKWYIFDRHKGEYID